MGRANEFLQCFFQIFAFWLLFWTSGVFLAKICFLIWKRFGLHQFWNAQAIHLRWYLWFVTRTLHISASQARKSKNFSRENFPERARISGHCQIWEKNAYYRSFNTNTNEKTLSRSRHFADHLDIFQIILSLLRSSGHFLDHPETFHIIWTLSDHLDTYQIILTPSTSSKYFQIIWTLIRP